MKTLIDFLKGAFPQHKIQENDFVLKAWQEILRAFPANVIFQAAKEYSRHAQVYPPNPGQLADLADSIWGAKLAADQAEKKRIDEESKTRMSGSKRGLDDVGRSSMELILSKVKGELTAEGYLSGIENLNRRFPGVCFGEEGQKLEMFYKQKGILPQGLQTAFSYDRHFKSHKPCPCDNGWIYITDAEGHSSAAKCGRCRVIGRKIVGKYEQELKIPYVDPETLEETVMVAP